MTNAKGLVLDLFENDDTSYVLGVLPECNRKVLIPLGSFED